MTTEIAANNMLVELQPMSGEAKPVTTSLKVAEYFGKEHKNVLRDIKDTTAKCSEAFNGRNFELVNYVDAKGETRPMYLLTRDGFMIVAMGYTGEKAMQLKEAYINAFNEMERQLTSNRKHYDMADALGAARIVFETAQLEGNQLTLAMDKIYRHVMGFSALEASGTRLLAPKQEVTLTPTEIGSQLEPALSAKVVNQLLADAGYQEKVAGYWQPLPKAAGMYELLDVGKSRSDSTPIKQLKWYSSVVDVVRKLVGQEAR